MKVYIENYDDLDLRFNNILINVTDCQDNQIKRYDRNNILYCEEPICNTECPVSTTATCYPGDKYNNDINKNICTCMAGWNGPYCKNEVLIDYR